MDAVFPTAGAEALGTDGIPNDMEYLLLDDYANATEVASRKSFESKFAKGGDPKKLATLAALTAKMATLRGSFEVQAGNQLANAAWSFRQQGWRHRGGSIQGYQERQWEILAPLAHIATDVGRVEAGS